MKQRNLYRGAIFSLLILAACSDDETKPSAPVSISFAAGSAVISGEADGAETFTIQFGAAARQAGSFTVEITSTEIYNTDYATIPNGSTGSFTIDVAAGQTSAQFTLTPINNALLDGDKEFTFTLADPTAAFTLGTDVEHTITITDDEGPSQVNFELASASVSEDAVGGIVVNLPLSSAALDAGSVEVTISSPTAVYTTNYSTEPAATSNVITLPVASDDNAVSFTVLPVDEAVNNDNYIITFTISNATGAVVAGTSNTYELTITDDDDEVLKTIAEIRSLFVASATIEENYVIQGIVTSSNPQVNKNNIWIQDNSGGIVVRFSSDNTIERGDEVTVKLKDGQFIEFNGLMQVQNVPNANATVVDQGNTLPTPEVITVAQLNGGSYEGKLVRVNDVAFVDADGTATMSGTKVISNGSTTTNVRTEATTGHPFKDSAMPLGFGTITGLAGENNGAAQIIPIIFADDVFASNAVGTIGVTQALTDFGSVDNGAESVSQSYTVQGTTLNSDVAITASTGFKVSTDNSTFTTSVTIPAASANSSTTVYVKFVPATGVNQAINGTVTHKSLGAAPVTFAVSGTESGNAVSTLLLSETFDYGASSGNLTTTSSNAWVAHSGAGSTPVQYVTTPLSMADYPGSNTGGAATFASGGSREDVNRVFTTQNSGTVYVSALISFSSAVATQEYSYHLRQSGGSFGTRFYAKDNGVGGVLFGISNTGSAINYSSTTYSYNTTYLVIIKYDFASSTSSLFILNAVDTSEPTANASDATAFTPTDYNQICIRQGSNAQAGTIDGIRVALSWSDLFN